MGVWHRHMGGMLVIVPMGMVVSRLMVGLFGLFMMMVIPIVFVMVVTAPIVVLMMVIPMVVVIFL